MTKVDQKLNIAVVVHGKFHAFDLSKALLARGHRVALFTNYPKFVLKENGLDSCEAITFVLHGFLVRLSQKIKTFLGIALPEAWLHRLFGEWAAAQVSKRSWDFILCWSGVSEELLLRIPKEKTKRILVRGSAHIREQRMLLDDEEKRCRMSVDKPSDWMILREEREYDLADAVRVLSFFSYQSFIKWGVSNTKLFYNPSAYPVTRFQSAPNVFQVRRERIRQGAPLCVLYVGNLSFQKGMFDLLKICAALPIDKFRFFLVGQKQDEVAGLFKKIPANVKLCGKHREKELIRFYEEADLFIFPTIQDGFPQVLAQAFISGLPILTTENCSGREVVREDCTGWIFPIRQPDRFVEKLLWCDRHREELSNIISNIEKDITAMSIRTWNDAAEEIEFFLSKSTQCASEQSC